MTDEARTPTEEKKPFFAILLWRSLRGYVTSLDRGGRALFVLTIVMLGGVAAVVAYALHAPSFGQFFSIASVGLAVSGAALLVGGTLGFLFGIPRTLQQDQGPAPGAEAQGGGGGSPRTPDYRVNTNLEQISDWLTKMLVGVGLTQINAIPGKLQALSAAIGQGMGDDPSAPTFALAIMLLFLVVGFLFGYLWARIFLVGVFAQADQALLGRIETKVRETESKVTKELAAFRNQAEHDSDIRSIVNQQLNPSPNFPQPTQEMLDEGMKLASRPTRSDIYFQVWDTRSANWRANKEKMERVIPVLRSMIASDPENEFHTNFGNLGFALKDQSKPDWEAALEALNTAIEIRNSRNEHRTWLFYEFARAQCLVHLAGGASTKQAILADLVAASTATEVRSALVKEPDLRKWMKLNGVTLREIDRRAKALMKDPAFAGPEGLRDE